MNENGVVFPEHMGYKTFKNEEEIIEHFQLEYLG
jgi:hypothetical protein